MSSIKSVSILRNLSGIPFLFFLIWLALAFLALDVFFAFISFAMACLLGLAVCFCLPCIIAFMCIYASQVHQRLTSASFPNTDLKFQVMRSNLMLEQINVLNHQVYKIVYGQRYSKRLNERQITTPLYFRFVHLATIHFAHFMLLQTVTHNAYSQDPYVKEFRIKFSQKLASVEARMLPPPWLKYHDTCCEKDCLPQVGQWNMMNKVVVQNCLKKKLLA